MRHDYESLRRLAKEQGRPVREKLALSHKHDPFYAGLPSRQRWAVWFAGHYRLWVATHPGLQPHLRRVHYYLVDPKLGVTLLPPERGKHRGQVRPYVNDTACWKQLLTASRDARLLGLVPRRGLEDHRSPAPRIHVHERPQPPRLVVATPDWADDAIGWPAYELQGWEPEQPTLIELWVEDSGQDDVLDPICDAYGVNLITGLGQMTWEAVELCWERIKNDGRDAVILYYSDYDLQGERMPIAVASKLQWLREQEDGRHAANMPRVRLHPVALSYTQVKEYDLPLMVSDNPDETLRKWQEKRGGRVELEALAARVPDVLPRVTRETIERFSDPALVERVRDAQAEATEKLEERRQEVLDRHPEVVELEERFAALRREQEELAALIAEELLEEELEVPERPAAEEPEGLEEEPLYDSERDYDEQSVVYQEWKSRNVLATDGEEEE